MNINKLHKKFIKKKISISVAESCTGGLLSSTFTKLSGSSEYFQMGLVTYSNKAKIKILKVKKKIIDKYGSVSPQCCRSMVQNLSKLSKSKINVSITGIAGPRGGTKEKPVGLVYIGLKKGNKVLVTKNLFNKKQRNNIQILTVKKTINLILNFI
ncbi:CinA family protein [Candidatus Pelagibacter sp.]|nr:CinA family protein [Candidatus Pelagibacter sp.]